jgi:hypothetical protein
MRLILPILVTAPNFRSCIAGGLMNGVYLAGMVAPILALVLVFLRVL